jgi:hypothetical protein
MGGITKAFVEITAPAGFSRPNLYPLQVISHHDQLYSSSNIVKIYLSQPDCYTPNTEDVAEIIHEANELGKTVLVDCSINDPRLLAMASPFRTEPEFKRFHDNLYNAKVFSNSIEPNYNGTDSESSDDNLNETTSSGIPPIQNLPNENPLIEAELRTYKSSGKTIYSDSTKNNTKRPQALVIPAAKQESGYDDYLHNIPRSWELKGVKLVLENLPESSKIHFTNISCAETVEYLYQNKESIPLVTWETSPNYIYFNENHLNQVDTTLKTYPPIRDKRNQEALFKLYCEGKIHCICSHHLYIKPEYKVKEFLRAMPGICSLGYGLSAIWSMFSDGSDQNITKILNSMCNNPSNITEMDSNIYIGGQGTFVIWNPSQQRKSFVYEDSPYRRENLKGEVFCVFLKGEIVYSLDSINNL